jgi:L-aspartate oxidase
VHGANRLASNSLLEGLVFAERIAADIAEKADLVDMVHLARGSDTAGNAAGAPVAIPPASPHQVPPAEVESGALVPLIAPEARAEIQRIMSQGAGVLRSADSLSHAAAALEAVHLNALRPDRSEGGEGGHGSATDRPETPKVGQPGVDSWETSNLLCVARVLVAAALEREETRGCHWREDCPERNDADWGSHLVARLRPDRGLVLRRTPGASFPPVHAGTDSRTGTQTGTRTQSGTAITAPATAIDPGTAAAPHTAVPVVPANLDAPREP